MMTRLRAAAISIIALGVVPFVPLTDGRGQPPDAKGESRRVFGDCYRCHNNGPTDEDEKSGASKLLTLKESRVWRNDDIHARAFESLTQPLGEHIGEVLYHDKDVTRRSECLVCHALDLSSRTAAHPSLEKLGPGDFFRKEGVSCEACHGLASVGGKQAEWFDAHRDPTWLKMAPADKTAKGFVDLRNPELRAATCAGCHVGNLAEGKFVTHAMYAAGHPPLPPLETLTYSRDEPSHAIPPRDNQYINALGDDDAWRLYHVRKGESASARQAAVGAAVGFREAMKSLATRPTRRRTAACSISPCSIAPPAITN
jgi:hypothetical protein